MTDKFEQSRICEPAFVQHGIHSENSLFFSWKVLIYRMHNNTRLVSGLICGSNCAIATPPGQPPDRNEKIVKIYAYPNPGESTVFKGQQTITAAPVITDFQFIAADLFA